MADDTPKTPQPNGIRPISIKPVAPAGAPPAAAPAADAAAPQPTIRLKPIVPRPFVAPGAAPAAPAAAPAPAAPAAAAPAPTPGPAPAPTAPAAAPGSAPTIRLKPVAPGIRPAAITANLKKPDAAAPAEDLAATIQISAPPPVSAAGDSGIKPAAPVAPRPLAPTPATPEMKSEQLQAAKSKTSRIDLNAALSAGEPAPGGPRTIRIKRPATEAPVGKLTSHIPAQSAPAAGGEDSTPIGQRRTIRVKRPPTGPAAAPAPAAAAEGEEKPAAADAVTPPEFATDVPPAAFAFNATPVEKTNPIFPILGLLAVAALAAAIFYLAIGDANVFNSALWPTPR